MPEIRHLSTLKKFSFYRFAVKQITLYDSYNRVFMIRFFIKIETIRYFLNKIADMRTVDWTSQFGEFCIIDIGHKLKMSSVYK